VKDKIDDLWFIKRLGICRCSMPPSECTAPDCQHAEGYERGKRDGIREGMLRAADSVATHWNDWGTTVNQREQAQRSAAVLRTEAIRAEAGES
jgi:hypothetical protein